jgi:hypothetical protein
MTMPSIDINAVYFCAVLLLALVWLSVVLVVLYRHTRLFSWLAMALSDDKGDPSASRLSMFLGAVAMAFGLLLIEVAYGIRVYQSSADPTALTDSLILALTTGGTGAYVMRNASKYKKDA